MAFCLLSLPAKAKEHTYDVAGQTDKYRIFVTVPDKRAPLSGWPVIYLLDGNTTFPLAKALKPEAILVGIGYPTEDRETIIQRRYYDLTVQAAADKIPLRPGMATPKTGGEAEFRHLIHDKIMPNINENFPTDPARTTLFGHSLGGIFTLRTAIEPKQPFSTVCAADPSIWWNGHSFMHDLARFQKNKTTPRILIMTAGKRVKKTGITPQQAEKIKTLRHGANGSDIAEILRSQKGVHLAFRTYPEESHGSLIAPALHTCITFSLDPKHSSFHSPD